MKDIPPIIKAARIRAGMTQQELGERMGYEGETAGATMRKWETGKTPVPMKKIRQLSAVLNLTLDDLIP